MIRVLIVDDHTIMRQGLKQILAETRDIVVIAEACNGQEAIEQVRQTDFDVVLLDVSMPAMDGFSALGLIKQERPDLRVLMLSMYPEEQYAVRLLKAGAAGYLTKESASEELIGAIRKIADGRRYITLALAESLAFALGPEAEQPPHELLSDREFQVMQAIASGKSVSDIAGELSLSVKTVSTYRTRILEKMGLKTNAEIMRYAMQEGLVL
jgi:two-component system, NarL family, invasion response regulator UvrY